MSISSVSTSFESTGIFSRIFLDYIHAEDGLAPFYSFPLTSEGILAAANQKSFTKDKREVLANTLEIQYQGIETSPLVKENLASLRAENTFTITTGHQLCLGTGPLYFIYKILTAIRLAEELNQSQSEKKFVPVFWMATEDHDIEEINHFYLFGKKYTWETDQTGAAGRLSTDTLSALWPSLPEKIQLFEQAYTNGKTLSEATRILVNEIFGTYGLLIIDGDTPALKREFIPVMENDIFNQHSLQCVTETSSLLEALHYPTQAKPREINFFYLMENSRERIVFENGEYQVLNSEVRFSPEELRKEIHDFPERFSPNVVLRPLYQDTILPNVVYVPGPGELAYWLQLKGVYDFYNETFPVLFPRQHHLLVTAPQQLKWKKLGFRLEELFENEAQLTQKLLSQKADSELDFGQEEELLTELANRLVEKILPVDKSLQGAVEAEMTKMKGILAGLVKRAQKSVKDKHDVEIKQISSLRAKWFPEGQPQERVENIMTFMLNKPDLISELHKACQPFDFQFHILTENDKG
ncbi:MAG: bacillithiol biosynthesis cysteine-adding enzyme BshC [Cytophagales bacterium]|nr:bacillithiol biosynthesis cysteine-adding enzyme BshC [Cytophagales bacterium]